VRKLTYGVLSSLLILSVTVPARAEIPSSAIAQSNEATIEQMFKEQRVLTNEIQTLMTQVKVLMAEMKALTALPEGQTPTMADLYKQQQLLMAQVQALTAQTRVETLLPRKGAATVKEVHEQQVAMIADIKSMMTELKSMIQIYRGRAGNGR